MAEIDAFRALRLNQNIKIATHDIHWMWHYSTSISDQNKCACYLLNETGRKKRKWSLNRQLTKLRSKCQTRCWSNMDQDSVTALSISCLRCCQKHILVCCLAVIWENLWHNRNLGNGCRGHRGTHICWHAHVVGPTTKTKPRSSDKKNTQRKHDLILCSHHHYFTTSLQRNELFADLLRLNIVAVFK